ncbi:MAG: hypothetical protein HYX75_11475, partial [Acidobacteria bacterium]|nr:hypothetical protein [Acidobacteriota bacterium]
HRSSLGPFGRLSDAKSIAYSGYRRGVEFLFTPHPHETPPVFHNANGSDLASGRQRADLEAMLFIGLLHRTVLSVVILA